MKKNRPLRFALAQMNPTVGDFAGNTRKIVSWIRRAEARRADMIVFPELAFSGYPVWDLANKAGFLREGLRCLEKAVSATRGLRIQAVAGFIEPPAGIDTPGSAEPVRGGASHIPRRSFNAAVWFSGGKVRFRQRKRLLPTYDVFLEEIFFDPGTASGIYPWKKIPAGITICEDIWDDAYRDKPLRDLDKAGAEFVVNVSASPYYRGVAAARDTLLRQHAVRYDLPILYVNQVGGQDDLVFDGRSLFVDPEGHVLFRAPAFEEGLFFFDWDREKRSSASLPLDEMRSSPEEMYRALTLGVRDYCRKNKFRKVVIGLSGGIDSALTAALAVDALGPEAVLGVTMPGNYSSRGSWEDSRLLADALGIEFRTYPILKKYEFLTRQYALQRGRKAPKGGRPTLAMENLQARIRGIELMYLSNDEGRLLLSTGNKSELAMGYCTLYGDMAGGLSVLGDVYKTDVYRLAMYRNSLSPVIPEAIITKPPSAELSPGQKDEDSLPPYEVLDEILFHYIQGNESRDAIIRRLKPRGISPRVISECIRKVDHNEYKRRQTPPILRVTEKAWFGRRMPITNCFDQQ